MARPPRRDPQPSGWPIAAEIAYRAAARRLLNQTRARLLAEVRDNAAGWIEEADRYRPDAADGSQFSGWAGTLAAVFRRLVDAMLGDLAAVPPIVTRVGEAVNARQQREWRMQVRRHYGVDVYKGEPWLRQEMLAWEIRNTELIRSIPQQALEQSRGLFHDAMQRGATHRELREIVAERFKVADSRADLIARDQVGKLDGQLTMLRQRDLGVKEFYWRTSGDERVRPTHRALNGKRIRWDQPPPEGHPGFPPRCRCRAEAIMPEIEEILNDGGAPLR